MRVVLSHQEMVDAIAYYLKHVKQMETESVLIGKDPTILWGSHLVATVETKDG